MQHFYDGQIRRYITQIVRLLSEFSYKDGQGNLVKIPVTYGDLTRQVGSILRDNSDNKLPSAPRMAVYITGLEMDTARLADSSYVNKLNIRERAFDANGNEYLKKEGKNYTVERLMPSPYTLSINVDIWSTNTDQKLQIMEQILMLFNPSLELQTTDNYIDWTSLSTLDLENITWSNRSIPIGTESEIDVGSISFKTPIYISPPVKVKKLGVITNIISAIFNDTGLEVNVNDSAYTQSLMQEGIVQESIDADPTKLPGERQSLTSETTLVSTTHDNYDLLFIDNVAKLIYRGNVGAETWTGYLKSIPQTFQEGITELRLQRSNGYEIIGTVEINIADETELLVTLDTDTLPADDLINGRTGIDYIINPLNFDPSDITKSSSPRVLLLGNIGNSIRKRFTSENTIFEINTEKSFDEIYGHKLYVNGVEVPSIAEAANQQPNSDFPFIEYVIKFEDGIVGTPDDSSYPPNTVIEYELFLNEDGADAWKNADGTDFSASQNNIVEYSNGKWHTVFEASVQNANTYVTNDNTGIQYKWTGTHWIKSFEGEYPNGTWRLQYY